MRYQCSNTCTVLGKVIKKPEVSFSFLSYLLQGEKNILIDTVPERAAVSFLEELSQTVSLTSLDAIILNHSESDHSGALGPLLAQIPNVPIYCTSACKARLETIYPSAKLLTVDHNSNLKIGEFTFHFIHTPGLHWDDNMLTYFENDRILFSNDLFGQYLGCEPPIEDELDIETILSSTKQYYEKVFSKASIEDKRILFDILALDIAMIAPGHGILLTQHRHDVLRFYHELFSS